MRISIKKVFVATFFALFLIFGFTVKASADQWYSPFSSVSNNIICKVGKPYTPANMNNGNCKVNWGNIVHNVANNMAGSWGDIHNPIP